jgi:preprotein translocase subunit SecB
MTADDNNDTPQPLANPSAGGAEGPSFSVLSQYVKDLSFENPHAPNKPAESKEGSNIDVQVNVGTTPLHDDAHEVTLNFRVEAKTGENTLFIVELVYAGVFKIVGVTQEALHPALLIEAPRHLFPFARQIIADVTQNSGYPTLMLDPINFAGLYQQGEARAAQESSETDNQPN